MSVEANAQWGVYCKPPSKGAREEAYAVWQGIYERQQKAHTEMTCAFYPLDKVRISK